MPESLIFLTENSPGVSNDRFGIMPRPSKAPFEPNTVSNLFEDG